MSQQSYNMGPPPYPQLNIQQPNTFPPQPQYQQQHPSQPPQGPYHASPYQQPYPSGTTPHPQQQHQAYTPSAATTHPSQYSSFPLPPYSYAPLPQHNQSLSQPASHTDRNFPSTPSQPRQPHPPMSYQSPHHHQQMHMPNPSHQMPPPPPQVNPMSMPYQQPYQQQPQPQPQLPRYQQIPQSAYANLAPPPQHQHQQAPPQSLMGDTRPLSHQQQPMQQPSYQHQQYQPMGDMRSAQYCTENARQFPVGSPSWIEWTRAAGRAAFITADRDISGFLDYQEFYNVITTLVGPRVTYQTALRLFSESDKDRNGRIGLNEFEQLYVSKIAQSIVW